MAQHYLKVSYRMFTNSAASHKLLYETEVTKPVAFVTDMGLMIDAFEERLTQLHPGESFDFTLQPAEAFGERDEDLVRAVPKKIFEVRGRFIEEEVYPGAEVPLMDSSSLSLSVRVSFTMRFRSAFRSFGLSGYTVRIRLTFSSSAIVLSAVVKAM